jgi:hypothetical protein
MWLLQVKMNMSAVSNRSLSTNEGETELAVALSELAELRARLSAETALRAKLQESRELRNTALDVVDKPGGDISVSSELGRGTQFTVRLPVNSHRCEKAPP